MEGYRARNANAGRDREVDVRSRLNALLPDHAGDLGALFGRKLCAGAGLSNGGLGLAVRRALLLRIHVAIAALAALGIHVTGTAFATFGLHVLAATLGIVLRIVFLGAHALRLLTLHVVLILGAAG